MRLRADQKVVELVGKKFQAVIGLSYGEKNVAPGEVVDDIPAKSVTWLLEQGAIVPAGSAKAADEGGK